MILGRFWWILEAKLSQVGMENRAKMDQKTYGKYDEKRKASWRRLGGLQNSWDALEAAARGRGGGGAGATPRKDS